MKILENKKGITLIALVVTIVVLLILVGVSINTIFTNNGLINKAHEAKNKYQEAEIKERLELIYKDYIIAKNLDNTITVDKFLESNNEIDGYVKKDNDYYIDIEEYEAKVDSDFNIMSLDKVDLIDIELLGQYQSGKELVNGEDYEEIDITVYVKDLKKIENPIFSIENGTKETWTSGDLHGKPSVQCVTFKVNKNGNLGIRISGTIKNKVVRGNLRVNVTQVRYKFADLPKRNLEHVSWEQLEKIAQEISNDPSITNKTVFVEKQGIKIAVGDSLKVKYKGEDKIVRVLGFNHDELVSPTAYGSTTATGKAGISFEFMNDLYKANMNGELGDFTISNNIGGWGACDLRTRLQNDVNKITSEGNKLIPIKEVKKEYIDIVQKENASDKNLIQYNGNKFANDKLWILSYSELYGGKGSQIFAEEGNQYSLYRTIKNWEYGLFIKGVRGWWLRTPDNNWKYYFYEITSNGSSYPTASSNGGNSVIPGFAI